LAVIFLQTFDSELARLNKQNPPDNDEKIKESLFLRQFEEKVSDALKSRLEAVNSTTSASENN